MTPSISAPIVRPGRNAWREVTADASGAIVDAADYYHALYWAAAGARRSILIAGWEFDSGVPLLRGADAPPGAEVRLLRFLNGLCERNPELYVSLLCWDFHMVFAGEREWMQRLYFHWTTSTRFHFRFDDSPVSGGSHHQKFAVIDGRLAFLGGMDVCEARWDDRRHLAGHPVRLSRGRPDKPYHDVQCYFAGGSTPAVLEELFFERWTRAGGTVPALPPPAAARGDFLPRGALPFGATRLALSRTYPRADGPPVREVEHLFEDAIASAERLIYIETQYFSGRRMCEALVERMRAPGRARLEIVIVVNEHAEALKEEIAVGLRQAQNLEALRAAAAETGHALGCFFSLCDGSDGGEVRGTYIHSKLMLVDDRFLTIGSANLTNRSMGVDSELHASWEARAGGDAALCRAIRRVRVSLLAEHSGASGLRPVRGLARIEGLVMRLEALAGRADGRLRRHGGPTPTQEAILAVVDPQSLPFDPEAEPAEQPRVTGSVS
jgi:phospholipase D1/2